MIRYIYVHSKADNMASSESSARHRN